MLKEGEKLWNGATVSAQLATVYNSLQQRIEGFKAAGLPVPEQLLNGAHNLIASAKPD
jgi:hypothetical protein